MKVLFVSVNRQPVPEMNLDQLRVAASEGWRITRAHAEACQYAVAIYQGHAVAAWTIEGSYKVERKPDEYVTRVGLLLGTSVPVQPLFQTANPGLRNGASWMDFEA